MRWADHIEELVNLCSCGKKAKFQARKVNGEFVLNGEEVVIDGSDSAVEYVPLCGVCYLKYVYDKDKQIE